MLSRYNGIGSLKLSIATAHNRRTSNIYINDVPQKDTRNHQIDATDTTYADMNSECSPALDNVRSMRSTSKLNTTSPQSQLNDLKANAKFHLKRKPLKSRQKSDINEKNTNCRKQNIIPKITSTNSIYSTSTISNSSLQEYDDNELDTTELAKYMRQINKEIHHDTK